MSTPETGDTGSGPPRGAPGQPRHPRPAEVQRRRQRRALVAAVLVVLVVGGVVWASAGRDSKRRSVRADRSDPTSSAPSTSGPTTGPGTTTPPKTTSTPAKVVRRAPTGPEITIAFAGDNNGEGLSDADIAGGMAQRSGPDEAAGCRAPISPWPTSRRPSRIRGVAAGKEFTFRAPPSILAGLQSVGVDVVSMANNHGLDFGPDGSGGLTRGQARRRRSRSSGSERTTTRRSPRRA